MSVLSVLLDPIKINTKTKGLLVITRPQAKVSSDYQQSLAPQILLSLKEVGTRPIIYTYLHQNLTKLPGIAV